jgi:hypothetical protein
VLGDVLGVGEALGDVVAVGLVVGVGLGSLDGEVVEVGDPVAVGLGDADAVGPASVLGSARALVAGAPTSATAMSRVPARRSRAPRGVVGVDIGAFLSGSRRDARTTGVPVTRAPSRIPRRCCGAARTCRVLRLVAIDVATHGCGTVPDLNRLPPNRCVWVPPEGDGQTLLPREGARLPCGCSSERWRVVVVGAWVVSGVVGAAGPVLGREVIEVVGVDVVGVEKGDALDGQDLGAVWAAVVAPDGRGPGLVAWWGCGVVFEVVLELAVRSVG